MKNIRELYTSNAYIRQNPSLFQDESPWKVSKITPLVDELFKNAFPDKRDITILDVGGGAGLILREVSAYIEKSYGVKVHKNIVDLTPGLLAEQKKNNPDIEKALNVDICNTPFADKEIDLCFMIDVLEHVPEPIAVLKELGRVAKFVVFKVPLEDILRWRLRASTLNGKERVRRLAEHGHINLYNISSLKKHIRHYCGDILKYSYTDVFSFNLARKREISAAMRLRLKFYALLHKIFPRLVCCVTTDYVMLLVKCHG